MKVLDLQCGQDHVFEGWFGSEDDFQSQHTRGLLTCPLCGDANVAKKLSAPRLNLSTTRGERQTTQHSVNTSNDSDESAAPSPSPAAPAEVPSLHEVTSSEPMQLQAAVLKMMRHVVANSEDVGDRFPEQARKMHYGEVESRSIRGQATPEEAQELSNEGIAVVSLPLLDALKEPLH